MQERQGEKTSERRETITPWIVAPAMLVLAFVLATKMFGSCGQLYMIFTVLTFNMHTIMGISSNVFSILGNEEIMFVDYFKTRNDLRCRTRTRRYWVHCTGKKSILLI
jgi:hypothetical protein